MKDLDRLLQEDYAKAADLMRFPDKRRLLDMYEKTQRRRSAKRALAFSAAIAAALIFAGSTAVALTNPTIRSELREIVRQCTNRLGITEEKADDLADRVEHLHVETDDQLDHQLGFDTNKYGETIGDGFISDMFKVTDPNDPSGTVGYVYRFDIGVLENFRLLPEELNALESSGLGTALTEPDIQNHETRDWVYAFDKDGVTIVGKYIDGPTGFKSNEQLKDPEVSQKFVEIGQYNGYETFVSDRTRHKLTTGTAFDIRGQGLNDSDLPTEGLDMRRYTICSDNLVLSDDATVVSSDPSIVEPLEVICTGAAVNDPKSRVIANIHKVGTAIITITDGDKVYKYEWSNTITNGWYKTSDRLIR